jgi:hypothetical protein
VELFLPLFWRDDRNSNGVAEPDEVAVLTGYPDDRRDFWIDAKGEFTAAYRSALERMSQPAPLAGDSKEQQRRKLVLAELAQGRPTLVATDLRADSPGEVAFVRHMLSAARGIERLYARQKGVLGLDSQIPADDLASRWAAHPWARSCSSRP